MNRYQTTQRQTDILSTNEFFLPQTFCFKDDLFCYEHLESEIASAAV